MLVPPLNETASFHVFFIKKTVSFKTTLFPFLFPLDVQQGKAVFSSFFNEPYMPHACHFPKPHTLSWWYTKGVAPCQPRPQPNQPGAVAGQPALLPMRCHRVAIGTPPFPFALYIPPNASTRKGGKGGGKEKIEKKREGTEERRGENRPKKRGKKTGKTYREGQWEVKERGPWELRKKRHWHRKRSGFEKPYLNGTKGKGNVAEEEEEKEEKGRAEAFFFSSTWNSSTVAWESSSVSHDIATGLPPQHRQRSSQSPSVSRDTATASTAPGTLFCPPFISFICPLFLLHAEHSCCM